MQNSTAITGSNSNPSRNNLTAANWEVKWQLSVWFRRSIQRNPALKESYVNIMNEYEQLGHMRKTEPLDISALHYYTPPHAVAIDRKFRVVFDASAKTTNGKSSTNCSMWVRDCKRIWWTLWRISEPASMMSRPTFAKCFVKLKFNQNIGRKTTNEPNCDYWLIVVPYGMTSSPWNTVKILIQCASDNSQFWGISTVSASHKRWFLYGRFIIIIARINHWCWQSEGGSDRNAA